MSYVIIPPISNKSSIFLFSFLVKESSKTDLFSENFFENSFIKSKSLSSFEFIKNTSILLSPVFSWLLFSAFLPTTKVWSSGFILISKYLLTISLTTGPQFIEVPAWTINTVTAISGSS